MENYYLIAKTLAGLEEVLAEEIKTIGGFDVHPARRAVVFKGDKKIIYRANYRLRTALRILKQIAVFKFQSVDDFYNQCRQINWQDLMTPRNTLHWC